MDAQQILRLSLVQIGKFREGPTLAYPSGRYLVAQRTSKENANYTSPNGTLLSVYQHFFPTNPRTVAQQANRARFANASRVSASGDVPFSAAIRTIMRARSISRRNANMRWLLSPAGAAFLASH